MLYATTRSKYNTYTAQRALKQDRAPDGGLYVPMQLLEYSAEQLEAFANRDSAGIIADILNAYFNRQIPGRDVARILGPYIPGIRTMTHKIVVGECWLKPQGSIDDWEKPLAELYSANQQENTVGEWFRIAVRIAALFALYGRIRAEGVVPAGAGSFDAAVSDNDPIGLMAVVYAAAMGLPVRNIVCCCEDESSVWELIRSAQLKFKAPDRLRGGIERLIHFSFGPNEATRYANAAKSYRPMRGDRLNIGCGIEACVVGSYRIPAAIVNLHTTSGYLLGSENAALYCGIMDYRASTGNHGTALLFAPAGPLHTGIAAAGDAGISNE